MKKKKKVMIVMSTPEWLSIFKNIIRQELPHLYHEVIFTDSFDEAVDLTPQLCELVVISCESFHDENSDYRETHGEIMADGEKSGTRLAEIIKQLNPKSKFYIFSSYDVEKSQFIDGGIKTHQYGNIFSSDVVKALEFMS